jgi:hypothetical protein
LWTLQVVPCNMDGTIDPFGHHSITRTCSLYAVFRCVYSKSWTTGKPKSLIYYVSSLLSPLDACIYMHARYWQGCVQCSPIAHEAYLPPNTCRTNSSVGKW